MGGQAYKPLDEDDDDDGMAHRAADGDTEALRMLLERTAPLAARVAYAVSGNHDDALDAAQSAMLRIAVGLKGEWRGHSFRAWATVCAHSAAVDQWRKQAKRRDRETAAARDLNPIAKDAAMPGHYLEQQEMFAALREEMLKLSPETAQIVALHHLHGLPLAEVGEQTALSIDACKMRLARGRERLRELLTARGFTLNNLAIGDLCGQALRHSDAWAARLPDATLAPIIQPAMNAALKTKLEPIQKRGSNAEAKVVMASKAARLKTSLVAGAAALLLVGLLLRHQISKFFERSDSRAALPAPADSGLAKTDRQNKHAAGLEEKSTARNHGNSNTAKKADGAARKIGIDGKTGSEMLAGSLDWLARVQDADGHFDGGKYGAIAGQDVAVTALALMALGGDVYARYAKKYKQAAGRSIAWLKAQQPADSTQMALRALALAEQFGMGNCDRAAAQRVVDELAARQDITGEWVDELATDGYARSTLPTTFAVCALRCAQVAGLRVGPEASNRIKTRLNECNPGKVASDAFVAAGVAVQAMLTESTPKLADAGANIDCMRPGVPVEGIGDEALVWYQGTLILFNKDKRFGEWAGALRKSLSKSQVRTGEFAGSWDFRQGSAPFRWGRVGATALCAMALDVDYRHRQIAGDSEQPIDREAVESSF